MEKADKKRFSFEISIEDVIRFLGPEARLYSDDSRVFIRELFQNAIDSIIVSRSKPVLDRIENRKNVLSFITKNRDSTKINHVWISFQDRKFMIEDDGIGLDEEGMGHLVHPLRGIDHYIGHELDPDTRSQVIGRFGAGLLSVFKVSDHIEIESKRSDQPACLLDVKIRHLNPSNRNDPKLILDSWLMSSSRKKIGTRVTIYLASDDDATRQRILAVDSADKIGQALNYYIRRWPPRINLSFDSGAGSRQLQAQPYRGQDITPHREINIPGVIGFIAYNPGQRESAFTVSQRGVLVKENYAELLPAGTYSITGEIDLQTTDRVTLKPSREEFVDDEKLARLKREIANQINIFMQNEYEEWNKQRSSLEEKEEHDTAGQFDDEEWSAVMEDLLQQYKQGNITVLPHFQRRVKFLVKTKEHPKGEKLILDDIYKLCRKKGKRTIYTYIERKFLYTFSTLDGARVYEQPSYGTLQGQIAVEKDEILIHLHEHGNQMLTSLEIIKKLMASISGGQISVVDLTIDRSLDKLIEDQVLPEIPDANVRMINLASAKEKRVFRPTSNNSWTIKKTHINSAHMQVGKILAQVDRIKEDPDKKTAYQAYIYLLAGKLEESIKLLETMLISSDTKDR